MVMNAVQKSDIAVLTSGVLDVVHLPVFGLMVLGLIFNYQMPLQLWWKLSCIAAPVLPPLHALLPLHTF